MIAVTMNNRKSLNESTNKIIILLNIISLVAGILLQRNEIFLDDWYIESIADGTFGESNIAFSTIGANQFFTFLIYLLSRINSHICWINIISLVSIFISNLIITNVIYSRKNNIIGYYICIIYLLAVLPITVFYMQFTTTSALIAASGAIWLFSETEAEKINTGRIRQYVLPGIWILFGCSMRFDAIYFSAAIIGTLVVLRFARDVKAKRKIVSAFTYGVLPFICVAALCLVFEAAHIYILNYENPGFYEWNEIRSKVDDYPLPDYDDFSKSYYDRLGLTANDVEVIQSWNDYDPEYIDEKLLKELLPIVRSTVNRQSSSYNYSSIFNNYFWLILVFALVYCAIERDWTKLAGSLIAIAAAIALIVYFIIRGRLIWRTEWPVFSTTLITLAYLSSTAENKRGNRFGTCKSWILIGACIYTMVFVNPCFGLRPTWAPYNGESLGRVYWHRMKSADTIGKYVAGCINGSHDVTYETFDAQTTQYCTNHKDNLYYVLISPVWLQENPSTNIDLYRTSGIGSSENRFSLGQYRAYLNPQKEILSRYGIDNPVKQLIDDRVSVIAYSADMPMQAKQLFTYLNQHYYDNVDFNVVEFLDRTTVGKFVISRQVDVNNFEPTDGAVELCDSEYLGYLKIRISSKDIRDDTSQVTIVGADNRCHTFPLISRGGEKYIYCLDNTFEIGECLNICIDEGGFERRFIGDLKFND